MIHSQYWYFKDNKDAVVKAEFLRKNVIIQPLKLRDGLYDFIMTQCRVSSKYGWFILSIKRFKQYFKPVSRIKSILLSYNSDCSLTETYYIYDRLAFGI